MCVFGLAIVISYCSKTCTVIPYGTKNAEKHSHFLLALLTFMPLQYYRRTPNTQKLLWPICTCDEVFLGHLQAHLTLRFLFIRNAHITKQHNHTTWILHSAVEKLHQFYVYTKEVCKNLSKGVCIVSEANQDEIWGDAKGPTGPVFLRWHFSGVLLLATVINSSRHSEVREFDSNKQKRKVGYFEIVLHWQYTLVKKCVAWTT